MKGTLVEAIQRVLAMPEPPQPQQGVELPASAKGSSIPDFPGVYFIWAESGCVYVGSAESLRYRLTKKHQRYKPGEVVTWLPRMASGMRLDEIYYIWLLEPCRNGECNNTRRGNPSISHKMKRGDL